MSMASSASGIPAQHTAFQTRKYSDTATELLRQGILTGEYEPGERLNELALSEKFRISRSPIREALKSLEAQGLVKIVPGRGAYVMDFDPEAIEQLGEVRIALETRAAKLAAIRGTAEQIAAIGALLERAGHAIEDRAMYPPDADFHSAVISASGNPRLVSMANEVNAQFRLARARSGSQPNRAQAAYREHLVIFEALQNRDADAAAKAMEAHLTNSTNSIVELIKAKS
jgi:DNA-binding GntR family transcriptional regulator